MDICNITKEELHELLNFYLKDDISIEASDCLHNEFETSTISQRRRTTISEMKSFRYMNIEQAKSEFGKWYYYVYLTGDADMVWINVHKFEKLKEEE